MADQLLKSELDRSAFIDAGDSFIKHPLLRQISSGTLSYEKWQQYVMTRLAAGDTFLKFLEALKASAINHGYVDLSSAVSDNIDEELGIYKGNEYAERRHDNWRSWCRNGVQRVLEGHGIDTEHTELPDVDFYEETLDSLVQEDDPIVMGGALAALEHIIACEYAKVLEGTSIQLPDLDARELTYWRSHAFHDHRHFDEIFEPLKALCNTPEQIDRAMKGLQIVLETKERFLNAIAT